MKDIFTVETKKLYEWFYLKGIPSPYRTMNSELLKLEDDEFNIILGDLKKVLNLMKGSDYSFQQIYDWATFFFYQMIDKLTSARRQGNIQTKFRLWEVGFEEDEIEYVIYQLCREVEVMSDEDETDDRLLHSFIDDLLLDIEFFEMEKEQGNVMRYRLSESRKADIIHYFAESYERTQDFNEEEMFLYKRMLLEVVACEEGIHRGLLKELLGEVQVVRLGESCSDIRLKYMIKYGTEEKGEMI